MKRYPTSQGLALPIQELGYEMVLPERRKTSQHHLYFEKNLYNTPIRHIFRNLIDHVVTMANQQHYELHNRFRGSAVPNNGLILDVLDEYMALNGVINCISERHTSQVYQLSQDNWQNIRENSGTRTD